MLMEEPDNYHKILDAAKTRFGYYGFNKTTMAEIAKDCNMSAANIYRHFEGKKEIISVLAERLFSYHETALSEIVEQSFPSHSEKLHSFFRKSLEITHEFVTEQPKMKEMVDFICQERIDIIQSHSSKKDELIAIILKDGVKSAEFSLQDMDIAGTALAFKDATVMFHTPLFMELYPVDYLKSSCTAVVKLLLRSITTASREKYAANQ